MIKWAGFLILLCGVGHTVGALVQTAPRYAAEWFSWALWEAANNNLVEMTHTAAAFWFTVFSFGPPLILLGLIVLWLGRRRITPPPVIAWALAGWTIVSGILSGPSPLLLLLLAAGLLIAAHHRAKRGDSAASAALSPSPASRGS